ncbi:Hypothetical protein PMT_2577 [Prochlorococcus marinus str. MIT 9313]|uniref:Uncharacterized protein n=1 Tax=Prochlorococcus marinus (strain MIT 9313) TaxID=74547 RepID=B9ERJ7_PROMM|nr:Hypothetical protein PMT_2577 [Prochlorococcus marinus str. MIT 9313]
MTYILLDPNQALFITVATAKGVELIQNPYSASQAAKIIIHSQELGRFVESLSNINYLNSHKLLR